MYLNNFVKLLRKKGIAEHAKTTKKMVLKSWLRLYRFKQMMKVNGMHIYQRLNKLDQNLNRRVYKIKNVVMERWKKVLAMQRFQCQVAPKIALGVYKLMLRIGLNSIKEQTGFVQSKSKLHYSHSTNNFQKTTMISKAN